MVFSSQVFVFIFLPLTILLGCGSLAAGKNKPAAVCVSNAFLLLASLVFYAWGEPLYVFLLIIETLFCYFMVVLMERAPKLRKLWLVSALVAVLGTLCFFKYSAFLTGIAAKILPLGGVHGALAKVALPLGISFYSFQLMSYFIDVYRGRIAPQKNFPRLLLYVSFFPQLVAGPIVKYSDVENMLTKRRFDVKEAAFGLRRFVVGLAKKLIIANTAALVTDSVFALETESLSSAAALIGALAYVAQIYFDFSGYSDMAIGIGRVFGFRFNENFRHPYASLSVKDFWRRWHVSLSTWFRDYLYIPLGGNRKGRLRTVVNKIIVFFFTGLWHGANYTFILWGLWHGAFLLLEEYTSGIREKIERRSHFLKVLSGLFGFIYTFAVVALGFIMFRSDSVTYGLKYIGRLFSFTGGMPAAVSLTLTPYAIFVLIIAVPAAMPLKDGCKVIFQKMLGTEKAVKMFEKSAFALESVSFALTLMLFIVCGMALASSSYNPFIYFRF
ncbi:MAG: MBOAT family protein [Clostridia bacterium]|nr:MBOAT family protein [Clostridia bacterium]